MIHQITFSEIISEPRTEPESFVPVCDEKTDAYRIPDEIWNTRCRVCVQKRGAKNIPIPKSDVHKPYIDEIIPCRVMAIAHPGAQIPGECMSFSPANVYGICATCKHNNIFSDGFCMKDEHGEERRVYYGITYNNDKPDYWGRHRLSVCDDYEPVSNNLLKGV